MTVRGRAHFHTLTIGCRFFLVNPRMYLVAGTSYGELYIRTLSLGQSDVLSLGGSTTSIVRTPFPMELCHCVKDAY